MNDFKKQEISEVFDKTTNDAPEFQGWTCIKVENSHSNGLSTYYTYIHGSKTLKIIVRVSDHFARHEDETRGFIDGDLIFPAVIKTTSFTIFNSLTWMEEKSDEYLIEKFCK